MATKKEIDAYFELKAWLRKPNNNQDTWRIHCLNYWLRELGGLAAVW